MQSTEARVGRVFVLRLEDGDVIPDCIEAFAADRGVQVGCALFVGGADQGEVVVGPRVSHATPPDPMTVPVDGASEAAAVGVLAPGPQGRPILHMHAALGRGGRTVTGCTRKGVRIWLVAEVVLWELTGAAAVRVRDPNSGFTLLQAGRDTEAEESSSSA